MIDETIGKDLVLGIGSKIDPQCEHHTQQQKAEAESLAKQVPNVQQVVNELKVKSNKHSTPSS